MTRAFLTIALIFLGLSTRAARAFPQMIARGYTSCTTCHFSPSGGGLLTPYGRSLSREALSQFGGEKEAQALHGLVSPPSWLHLGGDFRALQSYANSQMMEEAKFTVMQADAEVGVVTEDVRVVATLGYQNAMSAHATESPILSRKHYAELRFNDEDGLRFGRFNFAYGIQWPDHIMFQRRELGWDEGGETYQIEYSHIGEAWQTFATVSIGRPDAAALMTDRALGFTVVHPLGETSMVGTSLYAGGGDRGPRAMVGPFFGWTFAKHTTLFGQFDFQKMLGGSRGIALGVVETLRLQHELFQGLHLFLMQEWAKVDINTSFAKQAYTLGAQWFFRPHIEVAVGLRKQKTSPLAVGFTDLGWVVLHYYL